MPIDLWSASGTMSLGLPGGWQAYLLFLGYLVLTFALFYAYRDKLKDALQTNVGWTIGLAIAAFFTSQLFPLDFSFNAPMIDAQPIAALLLFAMIPVLLGSAILHPVSAFIVGASSGLGRALGQTHTVLDIFTVGFTAVTVAFVLQQNYQGRVYKWLREPIVGAIVGSFVMTFVTSLTVFASLSLDGLAALDRTLIATRLNFWAFLIANIFAGLVVMAVLRAKPDLVPPRPLVPPPTQTSLKYRLISYYTFFSIVIIIVGTAIGYLVISNTSTQAFLNGMTIDVTNAKVVLESQPPCDKHRRHYPAEAVLAMINIIWQHKTNW